MAVPWMQIVGLVPSILDVSRELLKRTKRTPVEPQTELTAAAPAEALASRIAALEENERQQAELVSQMAEQNAALARAITTLHSRLVRLGILTALALLTAVSAVIALVVR